jgi:hypothetical protein
MLSGYPFAAKGSQLLDKIACGPAQSPKSELNLLELLSCQRLDAMIGEQE